MSQNTGFKSAPKSISKAIKESQIIKDFLPPPDELVLKEENVKVTILLRKSSVDFFKDYAEKNGVSYQSMIKNVLDIYSKHYKVK